MTDCLRGAGAAIITPFAQSGEIDFQSFGRILDHVSPYLDFLVLQGTTGESAVCTTAEKEALVDFTFQRTEGRCVVVLGIGGNDTKKIKRELKHFEKYPLTAVLSVSPYYNRPTQEGIFWHYTALADDSTFPIILYNVPARTASNIKAETTLRLAENQRIIGIKEASGDILQCVQILRHRPEDFLVLAGDDAMTVPLIALGGDGVISVLANAFPKEFTQMTHFAIRGDFSDAAHYALRWANLYGLMFEEGNPTGIKQVMQILGLCEKYVRLPMVEASETLERKLRAEIELLTRIN